jgi:predicted CoA-substrate-specific enzyme activase
MKYLNMKRFTHKTLDMRDKTKKRADNDPIKGIGVSTFSLGVDLGSISLKVALLDGGGEILFSKWMRVSGDPFEAIVQILDELSLEYPDVTISNVGVTGSGRTLVSKAMSAVEINEITAHAAAAKVLHGDVRTIIEIGGQDSKLVILDESEDGNKRIIRDFRMNELCAAGTGAFLDQQATRLGMSIEEFAALADGETNAVPIAGRCAVFAKTDMVHHQQEGRPLSEIVAGLNEALVRSYLANLVRGRNLPTPIAFQGGVASNAGLAAAFRRLLELEEDELIIPSYHRVMGAIGAAYLASEKTDHDIPLRDLCEGVRERLNEYREKISSKGESRSLVRPELDPVEPDFRELCLDGAYVGIDIGSVSAKLVMIDGEGICFNDYRFTDGKPIETLRKMLDDAKEKISGVEIKGVGVTGSGRAFVGGLIGADVIKNEITAQAIGASAILPDVDTIVEIGGQDAKFLRIEGKRPTYFTMNKVCAAGTGAFLQEQAERLCIDLKEDFAPQAFLSNSPSELGSRCTVFMESDLVSHQQRGSAKVDLIAGLARSVIANYREKVIAGYPLGKRTLFIGGVAKNRAIVSALEEALETSIITSTVGDVSGAIGVAIASFEARRAGEYERSSFDLKSESLNYEQFICEECPNSCRITRTLGERQHTFGGRCGRWDASPRIINKTDGSLLDERRGMIESPAGPKSGGVDIEGKRRLRIGIPRALMTFDKLPAWRTFFTDLGCEVVLSPKSTKELFGEGFKHLTVETCLPVKAFCAHLHWLDQNGDVDYLFVPSTVIVGKDLHGKETLHCPFIQSLAQLAQPIVKGPILNPVINEKLRPNAEEREMLGVAEKLGVSKSRAIVAWQNAMAGDKRFREELRRIGDDVLSKLSDGSLSRVFVLLGKDYNIADPMLNSNAAKLLEERGEVVITQDMISDDRGDYSAKFENMVWTHAKEMLTSAGVAAKTPRLYPVMITSFGCGPDSFTIDCVRDIMGEKPLLLLEVDEHSSSVGMETRIEAFLDALPKSVIKVPDRPKVVYTNRKKLKYVYLPNFSDHSFAFAATIQHLGLEPVFTDLPSDETAKLGAAHANCGECHPFVLMLGDYLKATESISDVSDSCYFMSNSRACRMCQFGTQMKLIADKTESKLPILSRVDELVPDGVSINTSIKATLTYWEMMRGMDFFTQLVLERRAYEVEAGSVDRAHEIARTRLKEGIVAGRPRDGMKGAIDVIDAVAVDYTKKKIRIGITGDYFTRVCDYSNGHIFRDIERLGGVIMLPPTLTDFIKYDAYHLPMAFLRHRKPSELIKRLVVRGVVDRREKRVRRLFEDKLNYDIPLDFAASIKLFEKFIDPRQPPGIIGSAAAILEQLKAGADGILNIITFQCSYGLVLSSMMETIKKEYPHAPNLTLIFEGLDGTHNRTRLEAFMERVREGKA